MRLLFLAAIVAMSSSVASAYQVTDDLTVNGFIWFMYRSEITENNSGNNKKGFDTDEAEIDILWKLDETWTSHIGIITGRWQKYYDNDGNNTDADGPIVAMVKRANMKKDFGNGRKAIVGLQSSAWNKYMEIPWGYAWANLYQIGLRDGGFFHRHDMGVMYQGEAGDFFYNLFIHDGVGFANKDGIHNDDALVYTAGLGYNFMGGNGRAFFQYEYAESAIAAAGNNKAGHTVTSLAVYLKKIGPIDVMLEYHMAKSDAEVGEGYASFFHRAGGNTGPFDAAGYGFHLIGNVSDRLSFAFRYLGGNDDFVNKIGGISTGQHYTSVGGSGGTFKNRMTVGPIYHLIPGGRLSTALHYQQSDFSDTAKALPANAERDGARELTWLFSSTW